MQVLGDIGIVLLFIGTAGIFVAAEIALISLRESQIRQLAGKGKRGDRVVALTKNPNGFLAAVQIGITFLGFLSAAFGAERLGRYISPLFEDLGLSEGVSKTLALISITIVIAYVSLVFGELVPKRLALYRTEIIALAVAPLIDFTAKVFRPIIWLLSKSTDAIVKIFGIGAKETRNEISEAELAELVSGHTSLSDEEREIVEEVFAAGDLQLHEIMVPRTEVDFMDVGLSITDAIAVAIEHSHSRYPVTRGSTDEVIGFLHVRDLLNPRVHSSAGESILDLVRPVLNLPGTKGVLPALAEMRSKRSHIAVVLDEYGGTDGIITLEDLVECLIGDIHDEYDSEEVEVTPQARTGEFEIDSLISLEDLFDETGIVLPEGPYETVGGLVMDYLGRIPAPHDSITVNQVQITVLTVEGKRAGQLLISSNEWKDVPHE
ncbi:MAG: hemolysin family protein [Actinobacteria bacterium]|nr:hemolysin family protein [Actinomycetota bacterium]MDA2982162.1 hemolysin family protein [Actinomycetota bacterium]MDA2997013.1 hemolysin family protein [Actinomycetota bacterium]